MLFYFGVWFGALLQELVPFPSFLLFVPAGATMQAQDISLGPVFILALAIGFARVIAGLIVYGLSEGLYTALYADRTSWFGVKRSHVNKVRNKLGETGSWWTVFLMWALPIVPSTLIPLSAGFVRLPLRTFMTATYAGSIINALMYLLIGYYGIKGIGLLGV